MSKPSLRRPSVVCLISGHSLVLPELCRFLSRSPFRIVQCHIQLVGTTDVHRLHVPAASVHVLDSQSTCPTTEALVAAIRNHHRHARIVMLVKEFTDLHNFPLLRLGVKGLVSYTEAPRQLARAVKLVAGGGVWVPRVLMSRFLDSILGGVNTHVPGLASKNLSRREKEVLDCLLKNLSNKEIGNILHISESTVKFHVSNIFSRFGVQRRADLILQSFQERGVVIH